MSIHYIPWFTEQTYSIVKAFILPHLDMPDTYQEWCDMQTKKIAELEAKGDTVEKIEVNPYEFARYCERRQCKYDTAAILSFLFVKGSSEEQAVKSNN
jgi:hypothetical protein